MPVSLPRWADAHRADALDLVRIYLGLGLLARGVVFLADPAAYAALLPGGIESPFASLALTHYVALSHLAGGLLLALGMMTRLAALVQVPILAGAAFLVHLPAEGPFSQAFGFASLVLVLLVLFTMWGGGRWSLDEAVGRWATARAAIEDAEAEATVREIRERPRPSRGPLTAGGAAAAPCTCGHGRSHPSVRLEREYRGLRGLRFFTGTHARPSRAIYRCTECGGVVEVVEDPEALEALRYVHAA